MQHKYLERTWHQIKHLNLSATSTSINILKPSTFTFQRIACNYPFKWHTVAINRAISFHALSRECVNINYKQYRSVSDKKCLLCSSHSLTSTIKKEIFLQAMLQSLPATPNHTTSFSYHSHNENFWWKTGQVGVIDIRKETSC